MRLNGPLGGKAETHSSARSDPRWAEKKRVSAAGSSLEVPEEMGSAGGG